MGEVEVSKILTEEIGRDGGGFVREREFDREVGRASHTHRSIGQGEGDDRQGFRSEEGA